MREKKIINLVLDKKTQLITQPGAAGAHQNLAIAAVTGGILSPAWETYMKLFVSNNDPEQLARLLATDGTANDQTLIDCRAYLVSNGVCGETTRLRFEENVKSIDRDLETNCEPTPPPEPPQ
jgi:hypothetical protein